MGEKGIAVATQRAITLASNVFTSGEPTKEEMAGEKTSEKIRVIITEVAEIGTEQSEVIPIGVGTTRSLEEIFTIFGRASDTSTVAAVVVAKTSDEEIAQLAGTIDGPLN